MAICSLILREKVFEEVVPLVWVCGPFEDMFKVVLEFLIRFEWSCALPKLFEVDGSPFNV
jgi:hypothetical protein